MHTGIAAFYIKISILEKKYEEDESMQLHVNFLLHENNKLAASGIAFDDKFIAQILLMSLPHCVTLCVTPYQNSDPHFPSSHFHFQGPLFCFHYFSIPFDLFLELHMPDPACPPHFILVPRLP